MVNDEIGGSAPTGLELRRRPARSVGIHVELNGGLIGIEQRHGFPDSLGGFLPFGIDERRRRLRVGRLWKFRLRRRRIARRPSTRRTRHRYAAGLARPVARAMLVPTADAALAASALPAEAFAPARSWEPVRTGPAVPAVVAAVRAARARPARHPTRFARRPRSQRPRPVPLAGVVANLVARAISVSTAGAVFLRFLAAAQRRARRRG